MWCIVAYLLYLCFESFTYHCIIFLVHGYLGPRTTEHIHASKYVWFFDYIICFSFFFYMHVMFIHTSHLSIDSLSLYLILIASTPVLHLPVYLRHSLTLILCKVLSLPWLTLLSVLLLRLPCLCSTLDFLSCFDSLLPAYCSCFIYLNISCDCLLPALILCLFYKIVSVLNWILLLLMIDPCLSALLLLLLIKPQTDTNSADSSLQWYWCRTATSCVSLLCCYTNLNVLITSSEGSIGGYLKFTIITILAILNQACYKRMRGNQFYKIPSWIMI